jgi:hypothetical protein
MFLRKARVSELPDYLAVDPCHTGAEWVGTARALAIWRKLFFSPAFNCAVVEAKPAIGKHRIVGFGASIFTSSKIVDDELGNPAPGLNARIIQKMEEDRSVALAESELRAGNRQGGLDLIVLCGCWRKDLLTPDQVSEVQTLLASNFLRDHAGYRLRRLLTESLGDEEMRLIATSPGWQQVSDFGNSSGSNNLHRSLWLVTRNNGLAVPWSIASMLFHYHEPLLGLRPSDQRLLLAALDGMTDHELSDRLGLHLGTIKKRWIALFDRVADAQPGLLPEMNGQNNDHRRGPQKRHHVLAYVREHPEELRPFEIHAARRFERQMELVPAESHRERPSVQSAARYAS